MGRNVGDKVNQNYYQYYIKNTDYYRNLNNAIGLINDILKDIDELKQVLSDASGIIIDEMNADLQLLIDELSLYNEKIKNIQSDLLANAKVFDQVLTEWSQKKENENIIDEGYLICPTYYFGEGIKYSSNAYHSEKIKSFNSFSDFGTKGINDVIPYKYKTKISNVDVDSNSNNIIVEYKDFLKEYKVCGKNGIVNWEETFKDSNVIGEKSQPCMSNEINLIDYLKYKSKKND